MLVARVDRAAARLREGVALPRQNPGDPHSEKRSRENTVLRAMYILGDEGLGEFATGRGITVTGTAERAPC